MADKLSIASAVESVVMCGMNVTKGLYKIADKIALEHSDVRKCANEVSTMSTMLALIREKMLRSEGATIEEIALVMDAADVCGQLLISLDCVQEGIVSMMDSEIDSPKMRQIINYQISEYFSKCQKMLFLQEAISGHQQSLATLLAAASYSSGKDVMHKMALQNALTSGNGAADRFQGDAIRLYSNLDSQAPLAIMEIDVPAEGPSTSTERNFAPESQALNAVIEEQLSGTFMLEVYEEIRVISRKTIRFGKKMLENTVEEEVPSYSEATGSSNPSTAPSQLPARRVINPQRAAPVRTTTPSRQVGSTVPYITLQDSRGRYHNLSYEGVKTWAALKSVLKILYSSSGAAAEGWAEQWIKTAQHALRGLEYTVYDSITSKQIHDGNWSEVVRPGARIKMRFNFQQLNRG